MTTSNKRSNGHRNAVMNNTRVQRAVNKVIADQERAEELLEQLNVASTTAAAAAATADVVDTTAAETPEVPEKAPEEKFLAEFAAEKTFFKMLIRTLAIDEGVLIPYQQGSLFRPMAEVKLNREICLNPLSAGKSFQTNHIVGVTRLRTS